MTTGETYAEVSNQTVSAANGVEYVYRDAGHGGVPLVLLQHFRGMANRWVCSASRAQIGSKANSLSSHGPSNRVDSPSMVRNRGCMPLNQQLKV
jgi:hypothetical protein